MLLITLALLATSVLADKFIFMNQSLANELAKTGGTFEEQADRAVLNECIYEVETIKLWGTYNDFDYFKVGKQTNVKEALQDLQEGSKGIYKFSSYKNRRIITACAAGAMNQYSGLKENAVTHAEYAKKPLATRVGRLLKAQHIQWIKDPSGLNAINKQPELCAYLNRAQKRSYAWGLFVQIMLIFGYIDVNNPTKHINFLRVIEQSTFYKMYLERDHIILPTIDRVITLMLHDPTMQAYRSDSFTTLNGFKLGAEDKTKPLSDGDWMCDMDRLVIDYLKKQHNTDFHPRQLFA